MPTLRRGRRTSLKVSNSEAQSRLGTQVRRLTPSISPFSVLMLFLLGLLHMLYSTVCMIFWRVFMRISYTCPEHLKFTMEPEDWQQLVQLTGESIEWLDANERVYDVWFVVAYCATSCAL